MPDPLPTLDDYPIFAPDFDLPDRNQQPWSRRQARQYFDWFMEIKGPRIDFAHDFLALPRDLRALDKITALDDIITALQPERWRTEERMIPRAYSLGADIGLIFADTVEQTAAGKLHWQLAQHGDNLHVHENLPALHGFRFDKILEPVRIGVSLLHRAVISRPTGLDTAYRSWMGFIPD